MKLPIVSLLTPLILAGCPVRGTDADPNRNAEAGPTPSPPAGPAADQASPTPSPSPTPTPTPVPDAPPEKALTILVPLPGTQTITVQVFDADLLKPVRTDLWFYRQQGADWVPLTGVEPKNKPRRRVANFMLPRTVLGVETGYEPANDGGLHGVMTDKSDRNTIDGSVNVSLTPSGVPAGTKILIAAAREDQRYYGARVFLLPSGQPEDAPMFNTPVTHKLRTYEVDVKPILNRATCLGCHHESGQVSNMPMTTYRDIVLRDFKAPAGQDPFDTTKLGGERMIEPGAPALSGVVRRSTPGLGGDSALWYGKGSPSSRFNLDPAGNVVSDRRMPPNEVTGLTPDAAGAKTYFDDHLDEYKILWDWVAQGAPEK